MRAQVRVYVVLVNWNGWEDTCACLDGLLALRGARPVIVVCDNGSTNGSMQRLREWVARRGLPPCELDRAGAERGAGEGDAPVVLVQTGANLGFAGGCNVGIRYALARGDAGYVWLLNNDTRVDPHALQALVNRAQARPDAGIVGSTLLYHDRPGVVQALGGGRLDRRRIRSHHLGEGRKWGDAAAAVAVESIEGEMAYVVGASMLLTRRLLDTVGLLEPGYFLYFEEVDLAERAARAHPPLGLAYAADSLVWHKEGASAGTNRRSVTSSRWLARSRLRFTRRFYPRRVAAVMASTLLDAARQAVRGRFAIARAMVAAVFEPGWRGFSDG